MTQLLYYFLAEERQDQNAKRRKLEQQNQNGFSTGPSPTLALSAPLAPTTSSPVASAHPSLPQRPSYNFAATADSIGFGAPPTAQSIQNAPTAAEALAGSNRDVVANRRAIRMANMSAAEMLKAEMSGLSSVKPDRSLPIKPPSAAPVTGSHPATLEASPMASPPIRNFVPEPLDNDPYDVPGFGNHRNGTVLPLADVPMTAPPVESDTDADGDPDPDALAMNEGSANDVVQSAGIKRKFEEGPGIDDTDEDTIEDDGDVPADGPLALKVNPDGTVEQEDTVRFVFKITGHCNLLILG